MGTRCEPLGAKPGSGKPPGVPRWAWHGELSPQQSPSRNGGAWYAREGRVYEANLLNERWQVPRASLVGSLPYTPHFLPVLHHSPPILFAAVRSTLPS